MNDVMEQIKTLSATLDEETTRFHPTGRLLLLGSYESVFLKAVKRKADLLGIDCDLTQYPCPSYKAVVVDRETVPSDIKLAAEVDKPHFYNYIESTGKFNVLVFNCFDIRVVPHFFSPFAEVTNQF